MRLRLFLVSFALANLSYNGVQYAVTAQSETRPAVLSGEDMMRILPGNTLLALDESGPFWMYFPEPGTVWGQSSSGDVDIGRWWVENDRYCRSWRLWYDGATQCWTLATYGDDRIFWMDSQHAVQGESQVSQGNAIGSIPPPLLASTTTDIEIGPITVSGTIGPEPRTRFADSSGRNAGSTDGGSSGGGSSSGSGSSGSADSTGRDGSSGMARSVSPGSSAFIAAALPALASSDGSGVPSIEALSEQAIPAHARKLRVNERPTASSRESRFRRKARIREIVQVSAAARGREADYDEDLVQAAHRVLPGTRIAITPAEADARTAATIEPVSPLPLVRLC